ncbi:MAG: filamentous hemagglutinin N-terminal domain-containing protein, partial [Nevskia sp.]|nr:filamentous hemagglutinin N-terminal domain-containing protein [Nevskia sp.]
MNQHAPRFARLPIPAALSRSFAAATLLLPGLSLAGGPSGGVVVGGSATIGKPAPNGTVINQTSNSAIINWQQFNIGSGDYVQFIQPSSSSVVLNRIIGGSPSSIFGDLSANGRVFLINPNGILFGKGAQLDVGGLVASTMNIGNADFMAGHYVFSGGSAPGSSVVNAGTIRTGDGGFVVLAGDYVNNTGVIQARLGQVVLASGAATTLDLDGNGLVSFAVNQATLASKAGVDNAGQIIADGGRVLMTAQTAHDLVGSAVNNSGLVRAQGIASHNGEIELTASGGDITDSGTLDASNAGGTGGTISITADRNIDIQKDAQILAGGASGGKISIVADNQLNTRAGSLIQASGDGNQGGTAELSGHGQLVMRGDVRLGSGGTLQIDPTNITIANASGSSSSVSGNQTVYESFIAGQLQNGTNVQLVASNSITLNSLDNGILDGRSATGAGGGSLLLGIGTLNNGSYSEGSGGTISFQSTSNTIATYGGLTIDAGSTSGMVNVGKLIGGSVTVKGLAGISAGTITSSNGAINLNASGGSITTAALSAVNGTLSVSNSGGSVSVGNISVTSNGSYGASATANLSGSSGLTTGTITTGANTSQYGTADASVTLNSGTGNLQAGTITASAVANNAGNYYTNGVANVSINAGNRLTLNGITATASGRAGNTTTYSASASANVNINTGTYASSNGTTTYYGGAASTGVINTSATAGNGSANSGVSISTNNYGQVAGTLTTGVITTQASATAGAASDTINLTNNDGGITTSNLTTQGYATGSGNTFSGNINFTASNGNIGSGNLSALNSNISARTNSSGNITLGTLSGGS